MPYVERDENNNIKGVFTWMQPGIAEEWVEPATDEVITFIASTPADAALATGDEVVETKDTTP